MTEHELRDKITKIIASTWKEPVPCTIERKLEAIADALITAGIGDVSELQKECDSKEEAYNKCYFDYKYWKDKAEKYKHRAEVAERDKYLYCRSLYNLACKYVVSEHISTITGADGKSYIAGQEFCALCVMAEEAEQAKKELQEERKDD